MNVEKQLKAFAAKHEIRNYDDILDYDDVHDECITLIGQLFDEIGYYKPPTRVLVCGGRTFGQTAEDKSDKEVDRERTMFIVEMSKLSCRFDHEPFVIIQGAAKGADSMAKAWAITRDYEVDEYKPDWNQFGKRAGIMRNEEMFNESYPDIVVGFPGGTGTAHMLDYAEKNGVEVIRL